MSKDTEAVEPTLSEAQRAEWLRQVAICTPAWTLSAKTILAVDARLTWLETELARLVEAKTALLKDRDEWREAARAEAFLHDTVIKEHQSALASLTALRAELAQSRTEQQRVETALAEALRQLWKAKEEQRRGEEALRAENRRFRRLADQLVEYIPRDLWWDQAQMSWFDALCAALGILEPNRVDAALAPSSDAPTREVVGE